MAELADATDLKSVDFINREGSSPSIPKASSQIPDFYYRKKIINEDLTKVEGSYITIFTGLAFCQSWSNTLLLIKTVPRPLRWPGIRKATPSIIRLKPWGQGFVGHPFDHWTKVLGSGNNLKLKLQDFI